MEKQKGILSEGNNFTFAVALSADSDRNNGHIEIVGAGPGDPELISVRGKRMLEKADLILYAGSLVPRELTYYAKPGATVRSSADMTLEEQFTLMKSFYDKDCLWYVSTQVTRVFTELLPNKWHSSTNTE